MCRTWLCQLKATSLDGQKNEMFAIQDIRGLKGRYVSTFNLLLFKSGWGITLDIVYYATEGLDDPERG